MTKHYHDSFCVCTAVIESLSVQIELELFVVLEVNWRWRQFTSSSNLRLTLSIQLQEIYRVSKPITGAICKSANPELYSSLEVVSKPNSAPWPAGHQTEQLNAHTSELYKNV